MPFPNSLLGFLKKLSKVMSVRLLGYSLTLVTALLYGTANPLLYALENKTYDMRMVAEVDHKPKGDVVIASIDGKSLDALGRWPWDRNIVADLIARLDTLGSSVIALDVFFSEPENKNLLDMIRRLEQQKAYNPSSSPYRPIKQALNNDQVLANSIRKSGRVVLAISSMS